MSADHAAIFHALVHAQEALAFDERHGVVQIVRDETDVIVFDTSDAQARLL